jgi:glutamate---cysteine ligase / carboxylate-amine ligase
MEHSFSADRAYSVGVEEELFLVDPVTGGQINASAAVQSRLGSVEGEVERELHASQVELITDVCATADEASRALERLRASVLATGTGLLGSGTHPSAVEGDSEITDKQRYERIRELLGDAVATAVGGLHIHVGMPDPETAIRAFNGLRGHLALLQALAANSPFRHGRDTGLASAREVTIRGWPRSGVPRAVRDFDDFCELASLLVRAAEVEDYTWFWWKLRPHPRLGTVEVRALDAQSSLKDTASLVALTHCLALHAAREELDGGPELPAELLEESSFRAARYGVRARLPDADGSLHSVPELLEQALALVEAESRELGCGAELDHLVAMIDVGGGAGRQRAVHEIAGMDALLRELTVWTRGEDSSRRAG